MRKSIIGLLALLVAPGLVIGDDAPGTPAGPLRVMSFNIWVGGEAGRRPLSQTVAVIQAARADIVGLQETLGAERTGNDGEKTRPDNGRKIAEALGWHYVDQGGGTGILSRFPIVGATPNRWGATIALPGGRRVNFFNAHLAASPYQPYQLLGIPYGEAPFLKTEAEAIAAAREARGGQVERLVAEVREALKGGHPVFVTGDFNEPSHRDWTEAAVRAGHCPIAVHWPSIATLEELGLVDAFRSVHPDPVAVPGLTWTPTTAPDDPKDHHDRIDFVLASAGGVHFLETAIVGEDRKTSEVVVTPYPSDHRAVVVAVTLSEPRARSNGGDPFAIPGWHSNCCSENVAPAPKKRPGFAIKLNRMAWTGAIRIEMGFQLMRVDG